MSDCRVPMPTYAKPKELEKVDETLNEDIPIPDGWMAVYCPKARLELDFDSYSTKRYPTLSVNVEFNPKLGCQVINGNFNTFNPVDVLVLVRKENV